MRRQIVQLVYRNWGRPDPRSRDNQHRQYIWTWTTLTKAEKLQNTFPTLKNQLAVDEIPSIQISNLILLLVYRLSLLIGLAGCSFRYSLYSLSLSTLSLSLSVCGSVVLPIFAANGSEICWRAETIIICCSQTNQQLSNK